ncbi:Zinc transporter, putative [Hondaea fermentalgiana]|uniref:Zinc transporter, putative n=1 Tax=Hondaea fermentalgiana TaxID=2315210 RepID=A0A2R5G2K1_9STRA|nr:Zinc transporter, putative [Hondaea fermentalgiana]|eukprot:GBG24549.1 Zinc transporter, putative [Hondaea fermentalgiana]
MRAALDELPAGARPLALYGALNLALLVVEVGYGLYAGSLGLVSDGAHLGINCFGVALALAALRAGRDPPSVEACFGHDRVHVLAAFTNAVFMCFVAVFIVVEGLHQFLGVAHSHGLAQDHAGDHHEESPEAEMEGGDSLGVAGHGYLHHHAHQDHVLVVASAGLLVNLLGLALLAWSTRTASPSRTGARHAGPAFGGFSGTTGAFRRYESSAASAASTSRPIDEESARSARMLNLQGVVLHAVCDVLNSLGVICSAIMARRSGWKAADPLAAVIISLVIMRSSAPLLVSSGRMLLQVAPYGPRIALDKSIREISAMSGVLECHKDHIWEYAPNIPVTTLHVRARDGADEGSLLLHIHSILSSFSHHVTVQINKDHM